MNNKYRKIFSGSDLQICGADENLEARAIEHTRHPFYIGVAYQPERSTLDQKSHTLKRNDKLYFQQIKFSANTS